ncbi:hypothetical protein pb186bvf_012460 [Paramecium bursaria]
MFGKLISKFKYQPIQNQPEDFRTFIKNNQDQIDRFDYWRTFKFIFRKYFTYFIYIGYRAIYLWVHDNYEYFIVLTLLYYL